MIESFAQIADLSPEILAAFQLQEQVRQDGVDFALHALEISHQATNTVWNWGLPSVVGVAALIAPVLEQQPERSAALGETCGEQAVALAKQLLQWQTVMVMDHGRVKPSLPQSLLLLRRLLRQAYLDLPGLTLPLLLMAEHDAHLTFIPEYVAMYTESVFAPLAQMLGLWALRREWLEYSFSKLYPLEYENMMKSTKETELLTEEDIIELLQEERDFLNQQQEKEYLKKRGQAGRKIARRKALLYKSLKDKLTPLFEQEFSCPPSMQLMESHIGVFLWASKRAPERESKSGEKFAGRLKIKIKCESEQDCYRMLGIIHSLGRPVVLHSFVEGPRDYIVEGPRDYIAAPKTNGYRALHSTIVWGNDAEGKMPVSFCILTHEMHYLNEWGVVADLYGTGSSPLRSGKAWWNKLDEHDPRFQQRREYVAAWEVDTRSDRLYVFTREGDLVFLDNGCTALDFAYRIHKKLGDHAGKIEVNGEAIPYNYPLRNGELIHVYYDTNFTGPDLSWLGAVITPSARRRIRRRLIAHADSIHRSLRDIEQPLLKLIRYYKQTKNYDLTINTAQFEAFLMQKVEELHLPDIGALYALIEAGDLSPEELVHTMISAELTGMIVDEQGNILSYPAQRIHVCSTCWPAPGEAIIGIEFGQKLKIHTQASERCYRAARPNRFIAVRWLEQGQSDSKHMLLFRVEAENRHKMFNNMTHQIYAIPGITLHTFNAAAYGDGKATISFTVEAPSMSEMIRLQAQLGEIPGVRRVLALPPSPTQQIALLSSAEEERSSRYQSNPYTYQEVYDPIMFYDRVDSISKILGWLKQSARLEPLILHGQRRVGKTSLAKYLMQVVLPKEYLALPVFIDFQKLSLFTASSIADCFVQAVYEALGKAAPRRPGREEPMFWLSRVLREVIEQLQNRRLLLIIDEFNVLLDMEAAGKLKPEIFTNLRGVIHERCDLNWLLIVQDTHFFAPERLGGAGALLQQASALHLDHLDAGYALKLITEPIRRAGLQYTEPVAQGKMQHKEDIPGRILHLTNGNPFFIQVLCYELCRRALDQRRTNITRADLDLVVNLLTGPVEGARYFHHFVHNLSSIQKAILLAVAHGSKRREWLSTQDILTNLHQWRSPGDVLCEDVEREIEVLTHQGMLAQRQNHITQISIPIKLFQMYVEDCIPLASTIEEWKNGNHQRKRRNGHANK